MIYPLILVIRNPVNGGRRDVRASLEFFCAADSCLLPAYDDLRRRVLYRAREQARVI